MKALIHNPWFYILILAVGIFFKVYKIEQKFFWYDEVASIGHTSGNQIKAPAQNVILSMKEHKEKLRLNSQGYTLSSELKGLIKSTNLNPLHYPLLMVWTRVVGDEPLAYRWFNVFVFLLTLPLLYFLAMKLFKNPLAGWVAVTIYACSPYINFFVQEARYHTTWAFFIIATLYLFVIALERNQLKWWLGYVLAAVASLHISLISAPVLFGIFLWGFIYHKRSRRNLFITSTITILLYLPWVFWLYINRAQIDNSLAWHSLIGENVSFFKLLFAQFFVPAQSFGVPGDFISYRFPGSNSSFADFIPFYPLLLIIASIVFALRNKSNKAGTFLVYVFLPMVLLFIVSDIIRGVGGSMIHRYQVINVLGAILFVSYFLSDKLVHGKWPYLAAYALLLVMGVFTMIHASKNPVWDMPGPHKCHLTLEEGKFYSSKEAPLIISDFQNLPFRLGYLKFLELANSYESDDIDILYASHDIHDIDSLINSKDYSDVFISFSSAELVDHLKSDLGERIRESDFKGVAPIYIIDR